LDTLKEGVVQIKFKSSAKAVAESGTQLRQNLSVELALEDDPDLRHCWGAVWWWAKERVSNSNIDSNTKLLTTKG
jgi:hypothetical protein